MPPPRAQGSGYSLMQMAWVAEAFGVDEAGLQARILGTALEFLEARRVT